MKKGFLSGIFLMLVLFCGCLFYGCGDRYAGLSISIGFSYEQNSIVKDLDNGGVRVSTASGTFDDNKDGSYTFYLNKENTTASANLQVSFANAPDDFNYGASINFSNEIAKGGEVSRQTSNGFIKTLTVYDVGSTVLTVFSNEGNKKADVSIDVIQVANSISFVNNNYALTKTAGSYINLDRTQALKILPADSSVLPITYEFGYYTADNEFKTYSTQELWGHGLDFNKNTFILSVVGQLDLESLVIKACYENPLGEEDIVAFTEVIVVEKIDNFEMFIGSSSADATPENKIDSNFLANLIINMEDLNYIDVVLKAETKKEVVNFSYIVDDKLPVYFISSQSYEYVYFDSATNTTRKVQNYSEANYTYYHYRVVASKKTTENDLYGSEGKYLLNFTCNYGLYTVGGFPLKQELALKGDTLIKNFSVNDVLQESESIIDNNHFYDYYSSLIYINNASSVDGTKVKVDVVNPVSILNNNAKFKIALYYYNESSGTYQDISNNFSNYFAIQRSVLNTNSKVYVMDLNEKFDKGTTFFFKVNTSSGNVQINQKYFLIVTADLPNTEIFPNSEVDVLSKRAKATVGFSVVQGIESLTNVDFSVKNYEVDVTNGKYAKVDSDTKEYLKYDEELNAYYKLIDELEPDESENREYVEGEFVVNTNRKDDVLFNEENILTETIYIDLDSNFNANVSFEYLPVGADLNNIIVTSSDKSIFEITNFVDDNGITLTNKNKFGVKPKQVGKAFVSITATNLDFSYKIPVSVYKPITNMVVNLASTNLSYGIGYYENETIVDMNSLTTAVVKVGKIIKLNISTMPLNVTEYSVYYSVYSLKNDGSHEIDALQGEYSVAFDGTITNTNPSGLALIGDTNFSFNCSNTSFIFPQESSANKEYLLVVKLVNLDNSYFERKMILSSYVPVESIDTTVTKTSLYTPNTIAYTLKDETSLDPTAFGIKVDVNKVSKKVATYDFYNYGYIVVNHDGLTETLKLNEGLIETNASNKILLPISLGADENSFYWFKLSENYDYSRNNGVIFISLQVKEFDYYFTKTISVKVQDAIGVVNLRTESNTNLYFKDGVLDGNKISIVTETEKAYDNTLLLKVFDIVEYNNKIHYVDVTNSNGNIAKTELVKENSNTFSFNISSNRAGDSVVVVMPQDKIVSKALYDIWNNKTYVSVDVESGEFIENFYYIYENNKYVLATEYSNLQNYYISSTNILSFINIWHDNYLAFYVSIADGVKVPYQVSNVEELIDISVNNESVTKRYVLVNNLVLDIVQNWNPIGNFYKVEIDEENYFYEKNKYYFINEETGLFEKDNLSSMTEGREYYLYGFNGEFNSIFSYVDIKTGQRVERKHTITNIAFADTILEESSSYGLFSDLGKEALILNMSLAYNFFQPKVNGAFNFGGIAGTNHGRIINSVVNFSNISFEVKYSANIGGLVGQNFGLIENNSKNSTGITGTTEITISSAIADESEVNIGGLVGLNNGEIKGGFREEGDFEPIFNEAGFDSSLSITVLGDYKENVKTNIGGAVGSNFGFISNIAIQGSVKANNHNNVGGLIGYAGYNSEFNVLSNTESERKYSIMSSYSTAFVYGNNYVGGAFGSIEGEGENSVVLIYNVSAENYATVYNKTRYFVSGNDYVGGFAGKADNAFINYCYAVSYFDTSLGVEESLFKEKTCYDIISNKNAAGFIAKAVDVDVYNSSTFLNIYAGDNASLFVAKDIDTVSVFLSSVFSQGVLYSDAKKYANTLQANSIQEFAYYISVYFVDGIANQSMGYSVGGSTSTVTDISEIITQYGVLKANSSSTIINYDIDSSERENKINGGLPYLILNGNALYATVPLIVNIEVNNTNGKIETHIKNDNNSLVLFYNYDFLNLYSKYNNEIQALNFINLNSIAKLNVFAETYKSYRLDITTNNSNVVKVLNNGTLKLEGEGNAIVTISSKLNSNYKVELFIVVKYGLNDIDVYTNVTLTTSLNNSNIDILKSNNYPFYNESSYTRNIFSGENADNFIVSLKASNNYGIRFYIDNNEELSNLIASIDGVSSINDVVKFNGLNWEYDTDNNYYYVDVSSQRNPEINPQIATDRRITINYVPYLRETFKSVISKIILTEFEGHFSLQIKKGATSISLENNIDNIIKITQLETQSFTITMYTDFETDEIEELFSAVSYESYTDKTIWQVIENGEKSELDENIIIVRSNVSKKYKGSVLESISVTYTVNYKDKINAVDKDKIYELYFNALSDTTINLSVAFVILGQDKISQVFGTVYSGLSNFPQEPDSNNIIYNGNVGALSIEVYPYISDYNRMRVYYKSEVSYPLFITQLSYQINNSVSGEKLTQYPSSGSISDKNDYLWIDKFSGQDSYLFNNLGAYSYSKMYFLSLLVSSEVPDYSEYEIVVEFLNRKNIILETFSIKINTIAQPSITFGFEENLKGTDGKYYLPLNTENKMDIKLVNFEGSIEWSVTSSDIELSENLLEVLMPYQDASGNYYVRMMKYVSSESKKENIFTTSLLGCILTYTGVINDGKKYSEPFSIDVIPTLFTIRDIAVTNVNNGYMTLPVSTTTPLYATVDAYYDSNIDTNTDNWYNTYLYDESNNAEKGIVIGYLNQLGYAEETEFSNYITQLEKAISKVDYKSIGDRPKYKQSGIWYYNSKENAGYLTENMDYNNSVFSVELYNEYISVYGYQVDVNTNMSAKLSLSYSINDGSTTRYSLGIPNVINYNLSSDNTQFFTVAKFNKDFVLNFIYKSDLINAIPISTAEEFINMKEGFDYRLVNDIVLNDYTPISTAINSFDGNNYNIFITGFALGENYLENCSIGLFETVATNTILYNVSVCYTNRVTQNTTSDESGRVIYEYVPNLVGSLQVSLLDCNNVKFGGIAATNNGTITNAHVYGGINILINVDFNYGTIGEALNGGLVAINNESGYITYSKVKDFNLSCYGVTGGVVGNNNGKIVSTYLTSSTINNLSSETTGGFVNDNTGSIYECFVEGYRANADTDIKNTGAGLTSKGIVGGFVYSNSGKIADSYSNISLSSSQYIAGFVYSDSNESEISRCYSISFKSESDNSTIASPFAGTSTYNSITINGVLNNCYFLAGTGAWRDDIAWASNAENKQAKGLTLDEFATHTCFTNYDLSLIYNSGKYANGASYNFVDGYTWVIIEGKPVLVSTLVDTVSQRDYVGKTKNYSEQYMFFNSSSQKEDTIEVKLNATASSNSIRTNYYDNSHKKYSATNTNYLDEDLMYYTVLNKDKGTLTYFVNTNNSSLPTTTEQIAIVYDVTVNGDNTIETKKLRNAEYGNTEKVILDTRESLSASEYIDDKNYRANDTIYITFIEEGEGLTPLKLLSIEYFVLESASYYYGDSANGKSFSVGARTNPQIIYDFESFTYYLGKDNSSRYYRLIKDIDFEYNFTTTAYQKFRGALQGSYMSIDKLSISYLNNNSQLLNTTTDSFGLFAEISANEKAVEGYNDFTSTVISNLTINVVEVLSNSHKFVGALAGNIKGKLNTTKSVVLSNITLQGYNGERAYVQGKNAVGGLAGYVTGSVIIKDINSSLCVNATKEMGKGETTTFLYEAEVKDENIIANTNNISYAGGVIGIFDASSIQDVSTQKNYNANNIAVTGEITAIGGIVGSAFGLIGSNTIVNYVNTTIMNSNKNFLKAITYAGGLVGENRGQVISSSVTYGALETYSSVQVGASQLTTSNYFYNNASSGGVIAIGGLVGLNNGGVVINSISTINVRDRYTTIAGGAVGRMIEGKLENVIASGSVIANTVVGGLVGTINSRGILIGTEGAGQIYSEKAIKTYTDASVSKSTTIINSVAANNWLISDYTYYLHLLNTNNIVGAFIGLISYATISGVVTNIYDFVEIRGQNYFANTLYTSLNSNIPQKYLKVSYLSNTLDKVERPSENAIDVFVDSVGNQVAYPYSIREMYYENKLIGPYYTIKIENNQKFVYQEKNPYEPYIYTITGSNQVGNLSKLEGSSIYKQIDLTNASIWTERGILANKTDSQEIQDAFNWLINRFGKIYRVVDGEFVEVNSSTFTTITIVNDDDYLIPYYYIAKKDADSYPMLENFEIVNKYEASTNEIVVNNITTYQESGKTVLEIESLDVNGVRIKDLKLKVNESNANKFMSEEINIILPNESRITKVGIEYEELSISAGSVISAKIKEVEVYYEYNINSKYTSIEITNRSNIEKSFYLSLSSKEVIYNNFMNNGYWSAGNNFLLNNDYNLADKYLTNLEFATTYIWETFKANEFGSVNGNQIEISTAEQLALLAYNVNNGNSYNGYTINLVNDIDLSGKYWVPIGINESNVFEGLFDGKNHQIKYTTVNEKSSSNNQLLQYAGLFGVVKNAEIRNIYAIGGDIKGEVAGGIVAKVLGDSYINNITNRNNATGYTYAGGLVGVAENNIRLANIINYGNVKHNNYGLEVNIGGIIGSVLNEVKFINVGSGIYNYGNIGLNNNKTSYVTSNKASINIGGIIGYANKIACEIGEIESKGDINVVTNAHELNIGGVFGNCDDESSLLRRVSNYGDIEILYNNIVIVNNTNSASANIGGIVGKSKASIEVAGNEGDIDLRISTTSGSFIGIGGVVGNLVGGVEVDNYGKISQCYNSGDISFSSVNRKTTIGLGGVVGFANLSAININTVPTITIDNSYNAGDIHGDSNASSFVGGIFGANYTIDRRDGSETQNGIYANTNEDKYKELFGVNDIYGVVEIYRCLNTGNLNITAFNKNQNALGAIAGINELIDMSSNFYVRGSAYSGKLLFTGVCSLVNSVFEPLADYVVFEDENKKIMNAEAKLSATLKATENDTDCLYDWLSGADSVWTQVYDTWFPSLKGNEPSSVWTERQEVMTQEKGSYIIKTAEELAYFASMVNEGNLITNGISVKLAASIDLSNRYWTPIGTLDNPFMGTFDGNNYVIKNMTINGDIFGNEYLQKYFYGALFGYVVDATIKNVGIESPIVTNVRYASALAYSVTNSRIEKVYTDSRGSSDSIIFAKDVTAGGLIVGSGGLVYKMIDCSPLEANNMSGGLYYSYNNVPVRIEEQSDTDFVGGLVSTMNNSLIDNSYNNSAGRVHVVNNDYSSDLLGCLIVGNSDRNSSLFNVFNLAPLDTRNGTKEEEGVSLFKIHYDANIGRVSVMTNNEAPTFENLSKDTDVDLDTIWTTEYSLNIGEFTGYPSLRGLGKEWKNTETEALMTFFYETNVQSAENQIIKYVDSLGSANKTLVKVINPGNLSYLQANNNTVYLISSAEELAWIARNVNNGSLITTNCQFMLIKDIDLTGMYWTPIGTTSVYPFQGIFNFNGHTITGLTIDSNSFAYGGLFGYAQNAYILNGYIENAYINLSSTDNKTNIYVGTVVGRGYNTTIENISVTTILSASSNAGTFVGGIIGSLTGTSDYVISNTIVNVAEEEIRNNHGDIELTKRHIDISSYENYILEKSISAEDSILSDGSIHILGYSTGGNVYAGGVVGYISGYPQKETESKFLLEASTVRTNIAAVSVSNSSSVYIGGITGYALEEVKINAVESYSSLKSYTSQYDYIGGIVGRMYGGNITNSYFDGYLDCCQDSTHIWSYVGGIVGSFEYNGILGNLVNDGLARLNTNYSNIANIGGIVGRTYDHYFNKDSQSVYASSATGFEDAIGLIEFSEGVLAELEELKKTDEADYNSKVGPADKFTNKLEEFLGDNKYWETGSGVPVLVQTHVYLIGCQNSFGYNDSTLTDNPVLVNSLDSNITYTALTPNVNDIIVVGIVDRKFNYYYLELTNSTASNTINLKQAIKTMVQNYNDNHEIDIDIITGDDIDISKLVLCQVHLIAAEDTGE